MSGKDVRNLLKVAVLVAAGFGAHSAGGWLWGAFKQGAILVGTALLSRALSKTDEGFDIESPNQSFVAPTAPARWVFGRARIGGHRVWVSVGGENRRSLYEVLVLSEGRLTAIDKVYVDGEEIEFTRSGNTLSGAGRYLNHITITEEFALNSATRGQAARDADIGWTADHRLDGKSYALIHYQQNDYGRRPENKFYTRPPRIEFEVRGMRLTTRFDTGRREFTSNAADFWYWWMTERRGIDPMDIDEASFLAARTLCGQTSGVYTDSTRQRYEVNGVVSSGDSPAEVEDQLAHALAGGYVEYDGRFVLRPGSDRPVSYEIGEKDVIGEPILMIAPPQAQRINAVRATLLQDSQFDYAERGTPLTRDTAAIDRDGEELERDIGRLRFVNFQQQAQYINAIALRQARAARQINISVRPGDDFEYLGIVPGDIIGLTLPEFGYDGERFAVSRIEVRDDQSVNLDLIQTPDDLYDAPTFIDAPLPTTPAIRPDDLASPSNIVITTRGERASTTQGRISVDVSWDASPYSTTIEFHREGAGENDRTYIYTLPAHNRGSANLAIGTYEVRARHIDQVNGFVSEDAVLTYEVSADDLPSPPMPRLSSAIQIGRGFRLRYLQTTSEGDVPAPDASGLDIRFKRRDFDSNEELTTLTDDNWESAERMATQAVSPQIDETTPAIVDSVVETDGHYRIFMRSQSVFGTQSAIVEVGRFDLRRPTTDTFQVAAEPEFPDTKTRSAVYLNPEGEGILLPDTTSVRGRTLDDFDAVGGWPFGMTNDRSYMTEFLDLGEEFEVGVSVSTESFVPTGTTPDAPTLEVIHKDSADGTETAVEVEQDTEVLIGARFVAFRITFAEQGIKMASMTGRYDRNA